MNGLLRPIVCAAVAISLNACATKVTPNAREEKVDACRALLVMLDTRVEQARVGDAQFARIAGYPYLRINRFYAADDIKPAADSGKFETWAERLRGLDLNARKIELQNLPAGEKNALGADLYDRVADCSSSMMDAGLNSPEVRVRLLEAAQVPDDYSIAKRVFGLYPFTSLAFNAGVRDLHENIQADFARPLASLPVEGRITRFVPDIEIDIDGAASVRDLLTGAKRDVYGIPRLSTLELERVFDVFAPVYEIDIVSDDDRIGEPFWAEDGIASVNVGRPVVFRRVSYTRFEGRTLLQLNYSVWFPSRPPDGDFDLLSGRLDGITFRVTLAEDGRPLIYDSMHNCGCYHLFVPTKRLIRKTHSGGYEEPLLVPQQLEWTTGRMVLRISHAKHYLQRMYFDASFGEGEAYVMRNDDSLRSLTAANGERRSLFAPDGIVAGSERGERWLFWPMGIAEPGAMRQWGRHATAFVGIRHFDDPNLIERYFVSEKN